VYSLSKEELRSFLVKYHSLDNYNSLSQKRNGSPLSPSSQIKELLKRIGSVQYDPLNVVGRNSDLVFQSRVSGYHSDLLHELLYRERSLVDGWDKEMSIYLTADWPYFSRVRRRREEGARITLEYRNQKDALSYLPQILEDIKNRGPLSARNIKLGACEGGRWGHRQVSGAALDYLYHAGKLGIYNKKSEKKIYDLIENLLPKKILDAADPFPNDDAFLEWYFLRRIGSMGAHWLRNGGGWLGPYLGDSALRKKTFAILEEKELLVPVKVPELNETFYIRRKDMSLLNRKDEYDGAIRILAPLDNILWDRLLVKKVFDFEYTWEVYVPEAKRKYGYYVLPVLYRNNLIARFEPVKFEKSKPFAIKKWWWEPLYDKHASRGKKGNPEIINAVEKGLRIFADYLGADGVEKKLVPFLCK
jgi:uncharacterized protein YcaQ